MIDQSKFRFIIGDKIIYGEGVTTILGYYFFDGFNNFNDVYGYVIEASKKIGHSGSGKSYDFEGNNVTFDSCYFIVETDALPNYFSKLKPGDKIRVKNNLKNLFGYQLYINPDMKSSMGSIFTVRHVRKTTPNLDYEYPSYYHIEVNENEYIWSDKIVEKVPESESKNLFKDLNIFGNSSTNMSWDQSKISITSKSSKKSDKDLHLNIKKKKPKLNFKV